MVASEAVTTRNGDPVDDSPWRRPGTDGPAEGSRLNADTETPPATGPAYPGPPPAAAPPTGWRPPVVVHPAPPRQLPAQDLPAVEAEEASARTLTYGIGMVAAAVLVVVTCLLCSRVLF